MTSAALLNLLKSSNLRARKRNSVRSFIRPFKTNPRLHVGSVTSTAFTKVFHSPLIKRYLASVPKSPPAKNVHESPLPVRVALVSSSTALCTPVFPAIGFLNVILRTSIRDQQFRRQLSGSVGSVLSIAFYTIVPYSYQYAPLLLPCAIGNGIAAGGAYATLDVMAGGPTSTLGSKVLKNPLIAGGGIGAFTGFVAPLYLYGPIYNALYGLEGISDALYYWTFPHFTGISVTTGFAAGVAMYPVLHYPIYGIPSVPWVALTGVVLLGTSAALLHIYNPDDENVMPLPEGSFVAKKDVPLLNSIIRYDVENDKFGTYSLTANKYVGDTNQKEKGQQVAETVRKYQSGGWGYTFDNQVLAVLGNFFDSGIADRFRKNLVKVKDLRELQDFEEFMYRTDWVVKCVMERNRAAKNRNHYVASSQEAADVEKLKTYGIVSERECKRRLRNVESTSTAVELLMVVRLAENNIGEKSTTTSFMEKIVSSISIGKEPSIIELETWIRKRCPGILLYKDEENNAIDLSDQSVEAQLEKMDWKPPSYHVTLENWQEVCGQERGLKLRNGIMVTTGLLASYWLQF